VWSDTIESPVALTRFRARGEFDCLLIRCLHLLPESRHGFSQLHMLSREHVRSLPDATLARPPDEVHLMPTRVRQSTAELRQNRSSDATALAMTRMSPSNPVEAFNRS